MLEQLPAFLSTGEKFRSRLYTGQLGEEGLVDFREILKNEPYCSLIARYILYFYSYETLNNTNILYRFYRLLSLTVMRVYSYLIHILLLLLL